MRLLAVDSGNVFYYAECERCKDKFFYKTPGLLRSLWDKPEFDVDFKTHVLGCVNNRVERVIKGDL
jgi:hypothetical protein